MTLRLGVVAAALAALLGGCAEGGGFGGEAAGGAAVDAFMRICGRLEPEEVERRSRSYGFLPATAQRPDGTAPADPDLRILARPAATGGVSALVLWSPRGPSCELAVGEVDTNAVERGFARLVEGLQGQSGFTAQELPLPPSETDAKSGLRLRRLLLVTPRALVPVPPQLLALRTDPEGARLRAILTIQVPRAGGAAPAPPQALAVGPAKR